MKFWKCCPQNWTDFKMSTSELVIWFVYLRIFPIIYLYMNPHSKILWSHCEPSIYRVLFVMCDFLELLFKLAIFKWQLDKNHHVAKSVWKKNHSVQFGQYFKLQYLKNIQNKWILLKSLIKAVYSKSILSFLSFPQKFQKNSTAKLRVLTRLV